MKIKILMMPLMVIGIIYLSIWVAVPAYSDPEGIKDIQAKLAVSNEKLEDINRRIENAKKLANELNLDTPEQKMLFHYLPEKKLNEDVVASMNSMSSDSGVALINFSFKDAANEVRTVEQNLGTTMADGMEMNKAMSSPKNVEPQKTFSRDFIASATVAGDYAKIRSLVDSLAAFKRFNDIDSLSIVNKEGENLLEASLNIRFKYLDRARLISVIDKEMFKNPSFDMSIADEISKKTNINITKVGIDSAGRTNPFAL